MNLFRSLLEKLGIASKGYAGDDWPSVVLLLKAAEFPEPEVILRLAQESWKGKGNTEVKLLGTLRKKASFVFTCGTLWFSIHCQARPYGGGEGKEPTEVLQRPWDEHKAWMSIDLPHAKNVKLKQENALGDTYKMLLIYAFKVWSPNVLAVFFPAERTTIPNFGDLAKSIQWARRNGLDMTFID
jgi:hypothetical protein